MTKMEIFYKGNYYELVELKEPHEQTTFGIIAIFKTRYFKYDEDEQINITKEQFENEIDTSWELGNFVSYFYCTSDDKKVLCDIAKRYIDEYESGKNVTLLNLLSDLAQKRIQEHERTTTKDFDKLSKDDQFDLDDGDNLLQAIDTIKGVLEDGKED